MGVPARLSARLCALLENQVSLAFSQCQSLSGFP
jgi:hypothetical protein